MVISPSAVFVHSSRVPGWIWKSRAISGGTLTWLVSVTVVVMHKAYVSASAIASLENRLNSLITCFKTDESKKILHEVLTAVSGWRNTGQQLRLNAFTLDAYRSAFEHPLRDEAARLLGKSALRVRLKSPHTFVSSAALESSGPTTRAKSVSFGETVTGRRLKYRHLVPGARARSK